MTNHQSVRFLAGMARVLFAVLLLATPVLAGHYYVDATSGDDAGGDGSASHPWRTVTHGVATVPGPGDVLHVAGGRYDAALGEAARIPMKDGLEIFGAGRSETRIEATLVFENLASGTAIGSLAFTGFEATAGGQDCIVELSDCLVDLDYGTAYLNAWSGGRLEPWIKQSRIQGRAQHLMEFRASEGSELGGAFKDCSFYCGMDGTNVIYATLGSGSRLSTDWCGNLFDAKGHEGRMFWVGYDVIQPRNLFDSLYLNNTFLIDGFHLMQGVEHDLALVNNIMLGDNGLWLADPARVWNNLLTDPDFIGRNGNIGGDPEFVDPRSDYRLTPSSPCVDAGLGLSLLPVADARATPRRLDGDLDGEMRVDIGAYELTHAEMTLGGDQRPGGGLDVALTGPAGMLGYLYLGIQPAAVPLDRLGVLLLDPVAPFAPLYLGALPVTVSLALPDDSGLGGVRLYAQGLALRPAFPAGTLGNRTTTVLQQ